jgi:hypothetical protein
MSVGDDVDVQKALELFRDEHARALERYCSEAYDDIDISDFEAAWEDNVVNAYPDQWGIGAERNDVETALAKSYNWRWYGRSARWHRACILAFRPAFNEWVKAIRIDATQSWTSTFALCKLEEMKYASIEQEMSTRLYMAPRDSVEPNYRGCMRNTYEKHHGALRTTDELISANGFRDDSNEVVTRLGEGFDRNMQSPSPYIKAEPIDETPFPPTETKYSFIEIAHHITAFGDAPIDCIMPLCNDRFEHAQDFTQHLFDNHHEETRGFLWTSGRSRCPVQNCGVAEVYNFESAMDYWLSRHVPSRHPDKAGDGERLYRRFIARFEPS